MGRRSAPLRPWFGPMRALIAFSSAVTLVATLGGRSIAGDTPQASGAIAGSSGSAQSTRAQPDAEDGWLEGLEVSGVASQTFGMWQNPSALRDFTPSRNSLAVARSLLQVDENYTLNDNNSFFMREWFVYEPPYSFESANNTAYAQGSLGPLPLGGGAGSASFGHFLNDFYNRYDVRDAWWKTRIGPLTVYTGNQIVVWGQSLAFRVGDVVNPQDTTWNFGFANLEQSRTPQWMVHPILDLPDVGPLTSNSLEGLVIPRYQPQWTSVDFADGRFFDESGVAGSVNNGFPAASSGPSARFDVHYLNAFYPGRTALLAPSIHGPFGPQGAGLVGPPVSNQFFWCNNFGLAQPFNPVPASRQRPCSFSGDGTVKFGPTGSGAFVDIGQWKIPAATVANWEEGARIHTLLDSNEITAFFFNTWNSSPSLFWQQFTNQWRFKYLPATFVGLTWDRSLPIPPQFAEEFPFAARAEVVYANHQPFMSFDVLDDPAGVRYSDTVDTMIALDLDAAYAPWLTQTGNLTTFFELQDYITLDASQNLVTGGSPNGGVGGGVESVNKHEVNFLAFVGSSWWWETFAPNFAGIYNPKGNTLLLFPGITLTPPWTHKYFMTLQAIEVLGSDNKTVGGGLFKGESLLTAQFQYNFNLL